MKLHPTSTCVISWILAVALTVSTILAQSPPSPELKPIAPEGEDLPTTAGLSVQHDSITSVIAEEDNPPDASALAASPGVAPEATFPTVARRSTSMPPPSDPPGESKWIILAALLVTGAAVAAVLLFRGFGGNGGNKSNGQIGTVITAGPPSVNAPNR